MENSTILAPEQIEKIKSANPISLRHLFNYNHDDAIHFIKSLFKTSKTDELNETYWFPTPKNRGNGNEHTLLQTRNLNELVELEYLEKINPLEGMDSRNQIKSNFNWASPTPDRDTKQIVETNWRKYLLF